MTERNTLTQIIRDEEHAAAANALAARIAGVLTLWRDLDAPAVQAGDMADAIDLAQYYLS